MRDDVPSVPDTLPPAGLAIRMIEEAVDMPRSRLYGLSLRRLLEGNDWGRCWLVGSTVWMPAVFGTEADWTGDLDVVFESSAAAVDFAERAVTRLNGAKAHHSYVGYRTPAAQFERSTNSLNGSRVSHPEGGHVIDAWALDEGKTIEDLLDSFPGRPAIRCAFSLSSLRRPLTEWDDCPGDDADRILIRRVRPGLMDAVVTSFRSLFRSIRSSGRGAYGGA